MTSDHSPQSSDPQSRDRNSEAERRAILQLARSNNLGPTTHRALVAHFGSACDAVAALKAGTVPRLARNITLATDQKIDQEIDQVEKFGAKLIVLGDEDYPYLLSVLDPPPPVLTVYGDVSLLHPGGIAIIGARNASANGQKLAALLARGLGKAGHIIISGLARGIDAAAHNASLDTGTIAVLAGGIDKPYPDENRELYDQICLTGIVISEMAMTHVARAKDFPRRNRIISGLSRGVIVVEAAQKSGSLITARSALEQNRDVFAVPGSPLDARCRGTNQLLREGAILTESSADVLAHLPDQGPEVDCEPKPPRRSNQPKKKSVRAVRQTKPFDKPIKKTPTGSITLKDRVLNLLTSTPIGIDELVRQCECLPAELQTVLFELELSGEIIRHPGPAVSLSQ